MQLPTGLVTFVFTDIEGSTPLVRDLDELYPELLDQHHECLRRVWRAHSGHEVGTEGDSFFVAFADADDALAAMVEAQRALAVVRWVGGSTVRVRMGAHRGFARPHGDDYAALAVHQASRVASAAHGGQILLSGSVADATTRLPDGAVFEDLGRFRVRDFAEPVDLVRVRVDGVEDRDIAPRVRPAERHNLLRPPTTMHGRALDLVVLADAVRPGTVVTVVGRGGVGKTRLAVEHGLATADRWDDGVWFVDLSALTTPDLVDEATATAVGAATVPGRPTRLDVIEHLHDRNALVVLDNCEHLEPEPALLAHDLLQRCPSVGVLATSRSPLDLREERVHRLGTLPADSADGPAVTLFLERLGAGAGGDVDAVRELCMALDGLPLAIELAANRAAVLGVDAVLQRLRTSLAVVRSGDPTLPQRHRSLEELLDWSYGLLDESAQQLLHKLSLFVGTFHLDVVSEAWAGEASSDLWEQLFGLVDRSLVERDPGTGATRFRLHATVRSHAMARAGADELQRAAVQLGTVYQETLGPAHASHWRWTSSLDAEIDNIRGLIHRLAGVDDELAQELACAVVLHLDVTRAFATATQEAESYVQLLPTPSPARVGLLALLADVLMRTGRIDDAARALDQAQAVRADTDVPWWDPTCLDRTAAELALKRGEPEQAVAHATAALDSTLLPRSRTRLLNSIGIAKAMIGDLPGAIDAFREELSVHADSGEDLFAGTTHANVAEALLQTGDLQGAAEHQRRALEVARSYDDRVLLSFSLLVAARMSLSMARFVEALALQAGGEAMLESLAYQLYEGDERMLAEVRARAVEAIGPEEAAEAERQGRDRSENESADAAARVFESVTVN